MLAVAGVVAGGSLSLAGGATAEGNGLEAGWPQARGPVSSARMSALAHGADLAVRTEEVRDAFAFVDVGEPGESTGDFVHFEERLHHPRSEEVVGRAAVRCEMGVRTFTCSATLKIFGEGKIVVESATFGERDNKFAITGGTGSYAGLGGTLRPIEGPDGGTRLVLFFDR